MELDWIRFFSIRFEVILWCWKVIMKFIKLRFSLVRGRIGSSKIV